MSLIIEHVPNGFILKEADGQVMMVIQEPENVSDAEAAAESGAALLWEVIEYFGLYGNKYDAKRVRVVLEPGHCHNDYHAYVLEEYGISLGEHGVSILPAEPGLLRRFWNWINF